MAFFALKPKYNSKRGAMTNRNRLSTTIIMAFSTAVLLLAGSSCYTIIRHPRITQNDHYQRPENNRCFDCHTENEVYRFHHPVNISRPPISWDDSHYDPWWYDGYWSDENIYDSQYRNTLRPGGSKAIGSDGRVRAVRPVSGEILPPSIKVDDSRNKQAPKEKKDETPASEKRKLRPKKKKKKDG